MGCGTSVPPRVQPLTVGPPSTVPHHPEASPMDAYKVTPKRSPKTILNDGLTFHTKVPGADPARSPPESFTAQPRLRSMDSSAAENIWDTSSSPANRLPRYTLATLLRTVLEYLPPSRHTITTLECETALGKALRMYPAFMPEDDQGYLAAPPRSGTTEENAKKDMKAWLVASGFDRPATPSGQIGQEPSPASQALTNTYLSIKARFNDTLHGKEPSSSAADKDNSSSEDVPKVVNASPIYTAAPLPPLNIGDQSPTSPTRLRRGMGSPLMGDDMNSNSFLDRDTVVVNSDILLEECEASDQGSSASFGLALSPSTSGLDTSAHSVVSSTAAYRPSSPTRTMKHINVYREMRDVGMSKHKRRLAERVCAWQELAMLTLLEDPTNVQIVSHSIARSVSQTAAPLTVANLANLQAQLQTLRSRAAHSTLHPSPDNEDFFMNVPSAICWYYGGDIFNSDYSNPNTLSKILPPCVLRYPYHPVYGFAIARTADLTQRAAVKLSAIATVKEEEPVM